MLTTTLAAHRKTALALAVLLVLMIPVPHRIVPDWPVRVVDQNGMAVGGIPITQTWRHRAYQAQAQTETHHTDPDGRASFPKRTVWGSGLEYLYGLAANVVRDGTDATFGPDVWVYAKKDADFGSSNFYTIGQTPPDILVVKRYGVCASYHPSAANSEPGQLADLAASHVAKPPAPGKLKP